MPIYKNPQNGDTCNGPTGPTGWVIITFSELLSIVASRTPQSSIVVITPTPLQIGMSPMSTPAENKAALVAAIPLTGSRGKRIVLSDGVYPMGPGINFVNGQCNNTIGGIASCYAYEWNPITAAVLLKFAAGNNAFDLSAIAPVVNFGGGTYNKFVNMAIDGQGVCGTGVKSNGLTLFEDMNITGFIEAGIWLNEWTNMVSIDRVSVNGNYVGLLVGSGLPTFFDNTLFNVKNSSFRQNTVGVRIEQAINYSFSDCVIESNANEGLVLYRISTGTGHNQNQGATFENVWFENNGAGGNAKPQITIDASVRSMNSYDTPNGHVFRGGGARCYPSATPGVWKPLINIDCGHNILFDGMVLETADPLVDGLGKAVITLGANTSNIKFKNCTGNFTIVNNGAASNGII